MPIINLQKRARELGRIRLGQKGDRGQPQKLDRFRLTSASEPLLQKVAELYGGEVKPWTPDGGSPQFEVLTDSRRLPIMVPPQPVTQWHEAWRKSGCVHRCTGEINVLTDEPCDPEDPLHQEALKKPTTRLNVVLRDVEGIGVWRVETHGWHAAIELPDVAQFLAQAGGYVNGWLSLEQRTSIDSSGDRVQTHHFVVPIIEIDVTPAQLMAGHGRVALPGSEAGQLAAVGAGGRPAIGAGPQQPGEDLTSYYADLERATTGAEVLEIFDRAKAAGILGGNVPATHPLYVAIGERGRALSAAEAKPQGSADEPVDAVVVDESPAASEADPDVVWQQILATAGDLGADLGTVTRDFEQRMALAPGEASAGELQTYLGLLRTEGLDQAVPA